MEGVSFTSFEGPAGRAVLRVEGLGIESVELVLVDVGTTLILVESPVGIWSQAHVLIGQLLVFFIVHGLELLRGGFVLHGYLDMVGQ
jgi:hypothetical protein